MVFENGVKNIQAVAYNGARTVYKLTWVETHLKENPYFLAPEYGSRKYLNSTPNTQSCIKGLLVVRDFCFWAIWAARPVTKTKF
jgi:hypothetical protein